MEVKLSAYADDIINFLRNVRSVLMVLSELEKFEIHSGLKCNPPKCELTPLGDSEQVEVIFNGEVVKCVNEMKITGIIYSNNYENRVKANYDPLIEKLTNKLNMYKMRDLSLIGKIQILKTVGISQILQVMNVIEPTDEVLKVLNAIIFKF